MAAIPCWCGKATVIYRSDEVTITDTARTETRICPEHGEYWAEEHRPA